MCETPIAAYRQECQWCGEPVEYRDHHATQWECILALVGKCDRLQREYDALKASYDAVVEAHADV